MSPPDAKRAIAAMQTVQNLSGDELDLRISREAGDHVLAAFSATARALAPDDPPHETARKVQLLLMGYLIRGELDGSP